ncbi:hypothetical protein ABZV14_05755 [Streptosporangium canum]|uniref:hypothetical protein n=1 Tax=Streptosporangium canum TaxID=324952 RepID=UPI0033B54710
MRRIKFRKGIETVHVAFPSFVDDGFGGRYDYENPIIMATYRVPVKPISTRDWQGQTQTVSSVSIYFPSDARFDYQKPSPEWNGLFLWIRGKDWYIDGDPETWKFGGMPHIKVNAKRQAPAP